MFDASLLGTHYDKKIQGNKLLSKNILVMKIL